LQAGVLIHQDAHRAFGLKHLEDVSSGIPLVDDPVASHLPDVEQIPFQGLVVEWAGDKAQGVPIERMGFREQLPGTEMSCEVENTLSVAARDLVIVQAKP
jgi:hypothetical protein